MFRYRISITNSICNRVVVVPKTGDNLLTALCVARKCGMVPKTNKVILVEAEPSQLSLLDDNEQDARIEWKIAEDSTLVDNADFNANETSFKVNGCLFSFRN